MDIYLIPTQLLDKEEFISPKAKKELCKIVLKRDDGEVVHFVVEKPIFLKRFHEKDGTFDVTLKEMERLEVKEGRYGIKSGYIGEPKINN